MESKLKAISLSGTRITRKTADSDNLRRFRME
jgi:hypothetical protein